jgi:Zn-dependent M28 family amino/carboxypeptidase
VKEDTGIISPDKLRAHVQTLAGEIGVRNVFRREALQRAAAYIERTWRDQGYEVARHTYQANRVECANLEVTRRGTTRPGEIILIGAHYDTVDESPGANDNGSGVAALLELSRSLSSNAFSRTIRFVAFVNEEPPFFETEEMGSRAYAKLARQRGDDIRAMISLETIGYFSEKPGSQHYPPFFRWFYPDRGNFIGFVSDLRSRPLLQRAVAAFRAHTAFPVECCSTFARVPGVDWSDHGSFWHEGYRAFMVTDTAPYRYPHYHSGLDTPEKLNYPAIASVTVGLRGVISVLADGE